MRQIEDTVDTYRVREMTFPQFFDKTQNVIKIELKWSFGGRIIFWGSKAVFPIISSANIHLLMLIHRDLRYFIFENVF